VTERLWAPWRLEYVAGGADQPGCIFCDRAHGDDLVVHRGRHAFALMNLYPYSNGHLMIAPYRHVPLPGGLDSDERAEMWELLDAALGSLSRAMSPDGYNAGLNLGRVAGAGVEHHLHLHVVPRWNGDTNFMPVLGETRVLPELLAQTYERLRPLFEQG
jgi:ATP adenylyltransferase